MTQTHAVIEGVCRDQVVAQLRDAELEGDRIADLHEFLRFLLAGGADVDVKINDVELFAAIAFFGLHEMDRLAADHAQYRPLLAVDRQPRAGHHRQIDAADGHDVEITLIGDVIDEKADLVDVAGEHDARRAFGIEHEEGVAVDIGARVVDVRGEPFADDAGGPLLKSRDGGCGEEIGEELEGGFFHGCSLIARIGFIGQKADGTAAAYRKVGSDAQSG
jgi:hypothetical protein